MDILEVIAKLTILGVDSMHLWVFSYSQGTKWIFLGGGGGGGCLNFKYFRGMPDLPDIFLVDAASKPKLSVPLPRGQILSCPSLLSEIRLFQWGGC